MIPDFLSQYDIIIFDCDGVLIDVNLLKCEAFGKAVEEYPQEIVQGFVRHCKNTFGVSRYVKFKEFFSHFAKIPFQEDKYNTFLINYSNICKEMYQSANITPGCECLLEKLLNSNKSLYVASGSDEKELNEAFICRNLNKYFKGIYGSPRTKAECTSIILNENLNKKAVFIGDAISDMRTAKLFNIDFIYMSQFTVHCVENYMKCKEKAIKVIENLEDLLS